ncbi:MAG: quinone-dependent dihydroorotate dehydrogenase [Verrucomicrobia bacterium]|nr:quinone-dependent dihydroorotate dehydrogenase [Verrucomicrobiota bacterium]
MSWFYRRFVRPVLFERDSESIHDWTLQRLASVSRNRILCEAVAAFFDPPELPVRLWGLSFPNPVGLAAGMDKFAAALPAWTALGFGFSELGGVTWHAQPGNPTPRLFRAIADEALINRMGFNNPGAEALAKTLSEWRGARGRPKHPVGINLGKSKITPLDKAAGDYAASLHVLWPHADFFVVNVSSPNTPNLRQLQDKAALDEILVAVQEVNRKEAASTGEGNASELPKPSCTISNRQSPIANRQSPMANRELGKPILVKVAPDLSFEAVDEILALADSRRIAGIVATNTTIARTETTHPHSRRIYAQEGGLSGRPLRERSTEIVRHIGRQTAGRLPIIGVGGIFDAADAWEKIVAGASLVQVYTGLVYEGPGIVRDIVLGLRERLGRAGLRRLQDAVGVKRET